MKALADMYSAALVQELARLKLPEAREEVEVERPLAEVEVERLLAANVAALHGGMLTPTPSENQGSEASLPPATPSTTSAAPKAAGGKFLDHEAPAAVQGGPDFAQVSKIINIG